ncbi:MAG: hypothetical protein M3506_09005 [Chloroflexota bacterium]|nr:hypothetical protein [Chloroflexota bacterium]
MHTKTSPPPGVHIRTATIADLGAATLQGDERMSADIWVHPPAPEIERYLLYRMEARAIERAARVPAHHQVVLERVVNGVNDAAGIFLRTEGYALARRHWRMTFEMDAPPEAPAWPEGIRVRTAVRDRDERAIHHVIHDAFEDNWEQQKSTEDEAYEDFRTLMVDTYRYDPDLWWIAEDIASGAMAGVALGVNFSDMGWVRLVGVRRQWRRRGVSLGVDSESPTGANRLYERAGMRKTQQLDQYRKELRSGTDRTE